MLDKISVFFGSRQKSKSQHLYKCLRMESLEDRRMLATFTVTNDFDSGLQSLRWAIDQANSNNNPDEVDNIRFNSILHDETIDIFSALPVITEPVSIEVNPFFTGVTNTVTLDWKGSSGGFVSGLEFNITTNNLPSFGGFNTVNGLIIKNFTGHGIHVRDLSDDTSFQIEDGEIDGNGGDGIHIDLPSNQDIRNWSISGNIITNNAIGIYAKDIANTEFRIGSNYIGTDENSTSGKGNSSHGIHLEDVSAGGSNPSTLSLNVISGNNDHGIFLEDTFFGSSGSISSNDIGVHDTDAIAIPNAGDGIHLLRSRAEIEVNNIAGNFGNGITISDSDLVEVRNNRIGTRSPGIGSDLGNIGSGVLLSNGSQRNTIASNFIFFNDADGIALSGFSTDRNELTSNQFEGNSGEAIDLLGLEGADSNDENDGDFGPNDLINHPVLSDITLSNSIWSVGYEFDTDVGGDYRFEFYKYDSSTEGFDFIRSDSILGVTLASPAFTGTVEFADDTELSAEDVLRVIAIRDEGITSGNTSEFSIPVLVAESNADFDQDGDVDGADFLAWQRGFGMTGADRADGDANGDGMVDEDDLEIWADQFGFGTGINADFDGNGTVDAADLAMWQASYGQNAGGDADGDGDTDGLDFLAWQRGEMSQSEFTDWVMNAVTFLQFLESENVLVVSTTDDEVDGNFSLDDLSLREAIQLANNATTIILPEGHYQLTRSGAEGSNPILYNDLDITGDVTINGADIFAMAA